MMEGRSDVHIAWPIQETLNTRWGDEVYTAFIVGTHGARNRF